MSENDMVSRFRHILSADTSRASEFETPVDVFKSPATRSRPVGGYGSVPVVKEDDGGKKKGKGGRVLRYAAAACIIGAVIILIIWVAKMAIAAPKKSGGEGIMPSPEKALSTLSVEAKMPPVSQGAKGPPPPPPIATLVPPLTAWAPAMSQSATSSTQGMTQEQFQALQQQRQQERQPSRASLDDEFTEE